MIDGDLPKEIKTYSTWFPLSVAFNICAIVFVFATAFDVSNYRKSEKALRYESRCAEAEYKYKVFITENFKLDRANVEEISSANREKEYRDQQIQWCGLAAQKIGVDAAVMAATHSRWSTWLTVLGVVILGWTLVLTRRTLQEAALTTENSSKAVDEARRANEINSKIGQAQARAYLRVVPGGSLNFGVPAIGTIEIENTGDSPALRIRGTAKCVAVQTNERGVWGHRVDSYSTQIRCESVPAKSCGSARANWDWLPKQEEIARSQFNWVVYRGTLIWDDVFGSENSIPFEIAGKATRKGNSVGVEQFTEISHETFD